MLDKMVFRLDQYEKLIRLDRPIGILLLLWPTLWGLWMAWRGVPDWRTALAFVMGTILMRSAGCAINDFADRNFDGHVERTKNRPLATGAIKPWEAVAVAAVLAAFALGIAWIVLNAAVIKLAVVAFLLALVYPFTKRFLAIPQVWLGIAFGFGIPMAFAAVYGTIFGANLTVAWVMLVASAFWTIAYDTEYAMVDIEDDRKLGLKTSALFFGRFDVLAIMLCYAALLGIMGWVGWHMKQHWPYFTGLGLAGLVAGYHYFLIRQRDRAKCFRAFLHNHWIGLIIFVGIALDAWLYPLFKPSFIL
jgi:4-hydroxybenzoate polyprenyltransferase